MSTNKENEDNVAQRVVLYIVIYMFPLPNKLYIYILYIYIYIFRVLVIDIFGLLYNKNM